MNELKSNVFILSGPSCSGKNTVYSKIKEFFPDMKQTISATTRAQRPNETDGVDYYFVSAEEFKNMMKNGKFVEHTSYDNHLYATLKEELKNALNTNHVYMLIVDVNGALKIKELFPDIVTIFIAPPSLEEIKTRLIARGVNTEDEIKNRLSIAKSEMNQRFKYDYCVVNENIEKAVESVKDIILKHSKLKSEV